MGLFIEIVKFVIYLLILVLISKYILVKLLRDLAESLNLKPKTVGNIAGIATSVPELLTISLSSFVSLLDASVYNIISSNVINFVQYTFSILLNKNANVLKKNRALKTDIILVIMTILIPIFMVSFGIDMNATIVPIFLGLFFIFYYINRNTHKLFLQKYEREIEKKIEEEEKWKKGKKNLIIRYFIYLLLTSIGLFIVGNLLSDTLERLCNIFSVSQFVIGIALGFATSIPELITFFESQKHHNKLRNDKVGVVEATNNLLTSNVLNLFIIQSIGVIIYTIISK